MATTDVIKKIGGEPKTIPRFCFIGDFHATRHPKFEGSVYVC